MHAPHDAPTPTDPAPVLVFDGGCLFCRHFAELSELRSGIPGLGIRDGRSEHALRERLERRGVRLRDGAVLIDGERVLHGAEAIQWLCARMTPSAALLRLLAPLLATPARARALYPLLLLARRAALALRGLPLDPGETGAGRVVRLPEERRGSPDDTAGNGLGTARPPQKPVAHDTGAGCHGYRNPLE